MIELFEMTAWILVGIVVLRILEAVFYGKKGDMRRGKDEVDAFVLDMGQMIRYHRVRAYLTQAQLAQKIGVSLTTMWMWENGRRCPTIKKLVKLSDALQVNVELLIPSLPPEDENDENQMDIYDVPEED